jgi:DNA-binding MarR family transcriptional regulator
MELLNPLMGMIVLPYFGAAAARRELDRALPPPRTVAGTASLLSDPFKEAGMRLTWRTTLVLRVIAAEPGLSNRQIGRQADVNDQGQISKLLARLERLGLIANVGGRAKGDPNAWTLTPKGEEVERRIGAHTKALSSTTQGFPGRE